MVVCLWRESDEGFPMCDRGQPLQKLQIDLKLEAKGIFEGLEAGEYAVTAFHDEKNTLKIETNFIGMPKTGMAASGPRGRPRFSKSKFSIPQTQSIVLQMVYL